MYILVPIPTEPKLIRTRAQPLRNKQVFIEDCILKGSVLYYYVLKLNKNPPFSIKSNGLIDCNKCSLTETCG